MCVCVTVPMTAVELTHGCMFVLMYCVCMYVCAGDGREEVHVVSS